VLVCFWLVSRLEHRRWMEFMRSRVSSAVAAGGALAFAGLGFTAIYREGFETALFYQALVLFAEGLMLWVILGAAVAVAALVVVGFAILKAGRRLPIKPLLIGGAAMLLLLSVAFAGNAVRSLQGADVIGITPIEGDWARLPIFVAEMTGIHPTVQGIAVQIALLAVFSAGAAWVFFLKPRFESRRALSAESVS
jgi:high-affinity iron transporter